MHFLTPQALWLLLLPAIPVILYLLPLPRRRKTIASTLVWQWVLKLQGMSARRSIVRLLLAILVNVLIAVLIIAALGRVVFAPRGETPEGAIVVLVLDNSASMQAPEGGTTRFDLAKKRAAERVEGLASGTTVAVVTTAPEPELLVRPTDDLTAVREALRSVVAAKPGVTLDWIETAFGGDRRLAVHVFTDDGRVPVARTRFTAKWHLFGVSVPNTGIVAFGARRVDVPEPALLVRARIGNFSDTSRSIQLVLKADGTDLEPKPVELPPDSVTSAAWILTQTDATLLELELTPHDNFSLDDRAAAVLDPLVRKRVLLVAEKPPSHLLSALRADSTVRTFITKPASYRAGLKRDLTVFVGEPPNEMGPENALLVYAATDATRAKETGVSSVSLAPGHPVLRDITWRPGLVRHVVETRSPENMKPIVTSGERALVLAGADANRRTVALAFDPETQPIARTRTFPMLIRNITEYLAPRTSAAHSRAWHPGEIALIPVPATVRSAQLIRPDNTQVQAMIEDTAAVVAFTRVGVYRLDYRPVVAATARLLPVNLSDAAESDLRIKADEKTAAAEADAGWSPAFVWLMMIITATVLLALEAVLYHRRILE